ncbi:MAG: hypothetical protein K0Q79_1312 [Flavipsychrobacter sp.]|jgi:PIN domain nuclease of toxin-antitoxin system|nr:hypothetical protein [Flavipsychrobacter sp.]
MNYLLDTHTFLWYINDDKQISRNAVNAIASPGSSKFISIASLWEIAIKLNIGKLELDMPYKELSNQININGFELLPITFLHTTTLTTLERRHNDPFDRIIIAQALTENYTVISKDKNFEGYQELSVLW